jgi:hypothetical protein
MNQFPQAPEYPIRVVSNIRSSRCTSGVVDTGGKWKTIFHQKSFWTSLDSRVNISFQFSVSIILPPESLIPVVHLDFREFSKKIEMTLMIFSGAWGWGNMIHEKNMKQKIS